MNKMEIALLRTLLKVAEGKVPGLMPEARFRIIRTIAQAVLGDKLEKDSIMSEVHV